MIRKILQKVDSPEMWKNPSCSIIRGSFEPSDYKMSPEQAEEILKKCGILDENGEIVEAFKDILVKRKS